MDYTIIETLIQLIKNDLYERPEMSNSEIYLQYNLTDDNHVMVEVVDPVFNKDGSIEEIKRFVGKETPSFIDIGWFIQSSEHHGGKITPFTILERDGGRRTGYFNYFSKTVHHKAHNDEWNTTDSEVTMAMDDGEPLNNGEIMQLNTWITHNN